MIDEIIIKITRNLEDIIYLINYKEQTCTCNERTRRISEEDLNEIMNYLEDNQCVDTVTWFSYGLY